MNTVANLFFLISAFSLAGCGPGEAPKATVTGDVTYNGTPVERGTITFSSAEGEASSVTVDITAGKYTANTTAGPKKVMISGTRVVRMVKDAGNPDGPLLEQTENFIPDKFNISTELTMDVQKGSNTKNWDLVHKR